MASPPDRDTQESDAHTRLEASEARMRAVVNTAPDGIVLADSHGVIVQVNRAAEEMFGQTETELVGRAITVLMPERLRDAYRADLALFLSTVESRMMGRTLQWAGLRKDGQEFPVELSIATSDTPDGPIVTGILRDTSARRRADRELAEHRLQLEASNKELEAFSY